jgi:hypothetical protein
MTASQVATTANGIFDYSAMTEDFAGALTAAADRIKARERRAVTDIIEIGRELLAIKAELDHGLFLKWVSAEFRWSARTAQNYMAAAEWAGEKYETVSHLPPKLIYDLASKSTPAEIKSAVRADLDAGKPVDMKAVRDRIKHATKASRPPALEVAQCHREQEEPDQEPDVEQVEAEHKAAAAEIANILRKLPQPDIDRLLELLKTLKTAALWQVQEHLHRERA